MFRFPFKSKSRNVADRATKSAAASVRRPCMEALESRQLMSATLAPTPVGGAPLSTGTTASQVVSGDHASLKTGAPVRRVFRITNLRGNAAGVPASTSLVPTRIIAF